MGHNAQTSKGNFGRTLFEGLGQVLSNATQVHETIRRQQQAEQIQKFEIGLGLLQQQRQQQVADARILHLRKQGRKIDIDLQFAMASHQTPDEESALKIKTAKAISQNELETGLGFLESERAQEITGAFPGRRIGVGGVSIGTESSAGGLTGRAGFVERVFGPDAAADFILFGPQRSREQQAISLLQRAQGNPANIDMNGFLGVKGIVFNHIQQITGVDLKTYQIPEPPQPLIGLSGSVGDTTGTITDTTGTGETETERLEREIAELQSQIDAGKNK